MVCLLFVSLAYYTRFTTLATKVVLPVVAVLGLVCPDTLLLSGAVQLVALAVVAWRLATNDITLFNDDSFEMPLCFGVVIGLVVAALLLHPFAHVYWLSHSMWHVLNGILVAVVVLAMRPRPRPRRAGHVQALAGV
jgi:hypothetical protein